MTIFGRGVLETGTVDLHEILAVYQGHPTMFRPNSLVCYNRLKLFLQPLKVEI